MNVHEYVIYALDHYISIQRQFYQVTIPLANPTAKMLEHAASQFIRFNDSQYSHIFHREGRTFPRLSQMERVKTLAALENLDVDLHLLPSPFRNSGGLVKFITDALIRFSIFGYYSEWPAYGTTRLFPPGERRLQFFPIGWQQTGYPGVSLGYRDFRGFLLKMAKVEGSR